MAYIPHTREEKIQYSKQFSSKERKSYRVGKRNGFLEGIHKKNNVKRMPNKHNYSSDELNNLYCNFNNKK